MLRNASVKDLADFFRDCFDVPTYQRGYDWDDDNIEDFCKDLFDLIDNCLTSEHTLPEHFFGSLIVCDSPKLSKDTLHSYEVIDGQQRLATFWLTYRVFYDILDEWFAKLTGLDQKTASDTMLFIENNCILRYYPYAHGKNPYSQNLSLSKVNKNYFESLMFAPSISKATSRVVAPDSCPIVNLINSTSSHLKGNESNVKLCSAYRKIKNSFEEYFRSKEISPHSPQSSVQFLSQVVFQYLTNGCKFVFIVANSSAAGISLFSVLNDRGKALNEVQLLQARTMGLTSFFTEVQTKIEQIWNVLLKSEEKNCADFLRYFYCFKKSKAPGKRTLYDDYERDIFLVKGTSVFPLSDGLEKAQYLDYTMTEIGVNFEFYNNYIDHQWPYSKSSATLISSSIEAFFESIFSPLDHKLCIPLLMTAYNKLSNNNEFASLVRLVEKSFVRCIFSGGRPNQLEKLYMDCVSCLNSKGSSYIDVENIIKTKINNDYQISTVIPQIVDRLDYDKHKKHLLHLLVMLNEFYSSGYVQIAKNLQSIPHCLSPITRELHDIEHIYPKSLNNQASIPANQWVFDLALESEKMKLANLVLLSSRLNRGIKDCNYSTKVPTYQSANSPLIDKTVLNISSIAWTKNEYDKRKQQLITDLISIYQF